MQFRIADTFTESLGRLPDQEQKAVKTTAFDLQVNPSSPGMQLHKLDRARDPNFWSVRVSKDIRLILHKTSDSLLLCYAGHHDAAYKWAERRKLETHPKTGAAQLVEIRETVVEIPVPKYVDQYIPAPRKPAVFSGVREEQLLTYGVPKEWVPDVLNADEDSLLELARHLPAEAAEALLDLATGVTPQVVKPQPAMGPFDHPDAKRRFRVMSDVEELERALEYPWEKWTIFLHPEQRKTVEKDYPGPARISGTAGTGKTIVALHRAAFLARSNPDSRVLLTTFSDTLANALKAKLVRLIGKAPRVGDRVEVYSLSAIGQRLYELHLGPLRIASWDTVSGLLEEAARKTEGHKFSARFLMTEWEQIVDAWQLETWEAYRDVSRLGRKTRLKEQQRRLLWGIFGQVREGLKNLGLTTPSGVFNELASLMVKEKNPPFNYVVVDEAQDITAAQLRFLAALGAERPNCLFFAGDLGQRIFQQPFSWKALGVDIRGRSRHLRINYRTSHQIRTLADRLLGPELSDVDGNTEKRTGAISVFNGPKPVIAVLQSPEEEAEAVAKWLAERSREGVAPHEMGIFVRSSSQLERACQAVKSAGVPFRVLDEKVETAAGLASVCTMHLAKGLEFRAVAVMACDDEVLPLQERIETVSDDADLDDVFNTERHLLYVACTRARDYLLVTGVDPASEFIDDMKGERPGFGNSLPPEK
jgi:superfamily I DNA/RNA helicase/mRNA-degrading endonuclease RelE of RelBE toxin-antitoxin system